MAARSSRPLALQLLRWSEHVLFAVLLVLGVIGARSAAGWWLLLLGALAVAGWYLFGIAIARRGRYGEGNSGPRGLQWPAASWLAILTVGWLALAIGSAEFVWLAFPLFLLYTQLLPLPVALPGVAAVTIATVARIAADRGGLDAPALIGPLIGAAVAIVITVVYRDLVAQMRQRSTLIEQLTATRDELAASEHRAGVLAERERLAREVHDTLAQNVTSIVLVLRAARDRAARDDANAVGVTAQVDTAIDTAQTVLSDTRRMVQALTPAELSGRPLPEAIATVAANQPGHQARFHLEGEVRPVSTAVAVALLRAAQEALANARVHADAHRADVTLTFGSDAVTLAIVDDGIGFDPTRPHGPTTGTGVGLAGLRARIREIEGTVTIDSAPGRGTTVTITVPEREDVDG